MDNDLVSGNPFFGPKYFKSLQANIGKFLHDERYVITHGMSLFDREEEEASVPTSRRSRHEVKTRYQKRKAHEIEDAKKQFWHSENIRNALNNKRFKP